VHREDNSTPAFYCSRSKLKCFALVLMLIYRVHIKPPVEGRLCHAGNLDKHPVTCITDSHNYRTQIVRWFASSRSVCPRTHPHSNCLLAFLLFSFIFLSAYKKWLKHSHLLFLFFKGVSTLQSDRRRLPLTHSQPMRLSDKLKQVLDCNNFSRSHRRIGTNAEQLFLSLPVNGSNESGGDNCLALFCPFQKPFIAL